MMESNLKDFRHPNNVRAIARAVRRRFERLFAGRHGMECSICAHRIRHFRPFGDPPRQNAKCPNCGALERHRFAWLVLREKTNLFDGIPKKILHIAPEACFESRLRKLVGDGYVTADLEKPNVTLQMDITDIRLPDESFDAIICSHVLEHVLDDRRAMSELFRVLRRGGWALLDVPITVDITFEDDEIVEPAERKKAFGQADHVRRYGPDFTRRLDAAGFRTIVTTVSEQVPSEIARKFGILPMTRMTFLGFRD